MLKVFAAALIAFGLAAPAAAQAVSGTRLDIVATGEVTWVPDVVRISAGVVTQAPTASEAIRLNAAQMTRVRAALTRAGIADRDIQTRSISLQPDYRHVANRPPQLIGYQASNTVEVRFRDVAGTGAIIDALVAAGVNQIDGPSLGLERPEAALDEARTRALAAARERAELYARALGLRVKRILLISESALPGPPIAMFRMNEAAADVSTPVAPGEQTLSVSLTVSFELE